AERGPGRRFGDQGFEGAEMERADLGFHWLSPPHGSLRGPVRSGRDALRQRSLLQQGLRGLRTQFLLPRDGRSGRRCRQLDYRARVDSHANRHDGLRRHHIRVLPISGEPRFHGSQQCHILLRDCDIHRRSPDLPRVPLVPQEEGDRYLSQLQGTPTRVSLFPIMIEDPVLLNDWHPLAKSTDLGEASILPARLLNEDLVLWRIDGEVHVWQDLCVHRGTRLSLGSIDEEGRLVCAYHGWTYNSEGECVRFPAH